MKRSRIRRKPHRDPVTPGTAEYVAHRDGSCVMSQLDPTHVCRDKWGNETSPSAEYEIDHVDTSGLGRRGPSVPSNLVRLCPWGHTEKTYNARKWRPALRSYLAEVAA